MKSIDEIEKISFEELEAIASNESISAPDGLAESVRETVKAAAICSESRRSRSRTRTAFVIGAPSLAAAALAVALLIPSGTPKDTFDDPRLAYEEMERIMGLISSKADAGFSKTAKLSESVESINKAIDKLK